MKDIIMPYIPSLDHVVLSKHSIHIVPATAISVLIFFATWYANKITQKTIMHFGHQYHLEHKLLTAFKHISRIAIYSLGITLFLENLHIHMSSLLGTLGVVAVGIGFALQNTLANITSGMLILFHKPFSVGDYITGDYIYTNLPKFKGKVIDIDLATTTLDHKGDIILIPNQTIYNSTITIRKKHTES